MTTVRQLLRTVASPLHPKSIVSWHSFSYDKQPFCHHYSFTFDISSLIVNHHCAVTFLLHRLGIANNCIILPHRSRRQGSWVGDDIMEKAFT